LDPESEIRDKHARILNTRFSVEFQKCKAAIEGREGRDFVCSLLSAVFPARQKLRLTLSRLTPLAAQGREMEKALLNFLIAVKHAS
jgi:hypothetical protein